LFFALLSLASFFITMTLSGKISTEIGVHATAAKWFNFQLTQLHQVQHLTDHVHETRLHEGEDWHHHETIKHWTYVIGKYANKTYRGDIHLL